MKLFRFKLIAEPKDREYGVLFRILGIDFLVSTSWWLDVWSLLYFVLFNKGCFGFYAQSLFLSIYVGAPKDLLYEEPKEILKDKLEEA